MSIGAIAAAAGYSERVVYHNIKPLLARGRIKRVIVEEIGVLNRRPNPRGRVRTYFQLVP